ncbi:ferredoxin [Streptomyces olivoreticuli]
MSAEPRWRITVNRDVCIGAGMCRGDLPHRFQYVNGQSQPVDAEIDADDEVLAVADSCPSEAIEVVEILTGRVIAPLD